MSANSDEWHGECIMTVTTTLSPSSLLPEVTMLRYALLFLVVALIAGVFGFTDVAGTSYLVAKIFFFVFLILFVVSLVLGRGTRAIE
jgi:uncharacterized membrane protein YtjA (UPF0391 family)